MAHTVFYAWQSDTDPAANHQFVAEALQTAITRLNVDLRLHESESALMFDRDVHGEPGMPPVADTLLRKIAGASVFVADLTFVARVAARNKGLPNANVSIELGYAARAITFDRIVCVFNRHYGSPEHLPFDLAHRKFPVQYTLAPDASNEEREGQLLQLTNALTTQLRTVIDKVGLISPSDFPEKPLHAVAPLEAFSFMEPSRQIAQAKARDSEGRESEYVFWHQGPGAWLRLLPARSKNLLRPQLSRLVRNPALPLQPFGEGTRCQIESNEFGVVALGYQDDELPANAMELTQVFRSGEIWGLNRSLIEPQRTEPHRTFQIPWPATRQQFQRTLVHYIAFAHRVLDVNLPVTIVAGLALVDQALFVPAKRHWSAAPEKPTRCFERFIRKHIVVSRWDVSVDELLNPFFRLILEACDQDYDEWQTITWPKG